MSKAINEMRAYFNQMPVPPKGALLEARKKVNAMIDAVEAENTKLLEDLEFERFENGWAREFLDRMAKHCGTKDCSSLAAYVEELESENAKLIELNNIRILQTQHCEELTAENAKLRKLVQDMWDWLAPTAEGGAPLNELYGRMRKLGIWED